MFSRALASLLFVLQVLPALCCMAMGRADAVVANAPHDSSEPQSCCCAVPTQTSSCADRSPERPSSLLALQSCKDSSRRCPICVNLCGSSRETPLDRKPARSAKTLSLDLGFPGGSHPAIASVPEIAARFHGWDSSPARVVTGDRLRATTGVWTI